MKDKNRKRLAVVTGGNRGLGLETCNQLAGSRKILLTARVAVQASDAAKRLAAKGLDVRHEQLDVADRASIARLAEKLKRKHAAVEALVNNAAVALNGFDGRVARETIDVNFFGAAAVTDAFLPLLSQRACIVMVSSGMGELSCLSPELRELFEAPDLTRNQLDDLMNGFVRDVEEGVCAERGWPQSAYRVSKAGLNALVRILARELADTGMKVNAVSPGWVRTDMGGANAARSVEDGARGIVWAATLPADGPTGGFFRDGKPIPW